MSQKLSGEDFEWIKGTPQFKENLIKDYSEESDEGYFLEVNAQYLKKLNELLNDSPLLPKE